jgi:hypothetical protein
MRWIIAVALVAQQDLLADLRDQTEAREGHTMHQPRGRRCAVERQPWERLNRSILADDVREALDELRTAGVHPLHLAL